MEELVELQGFAVDERKATPTFHRLRSLELRRNNPKLEYLFDKKVCVVFWKTLSHYEIKETSENQNKNTSISSHNG